MKKILIILILIIIIISSCGKEKEEVVVEQTEFDVELVDTGKKKNQIIKIIDKNTDNNLLESKRLIKNLPVILLEDVDKKTAEALKEKLEEKGATVNIK